MSLREHMISSSSGLFASCGENHSHASQIEAETHSMSSLEPIVQSRKVVMMDGGAGECYRLASLLHQPQGLAPHGNVVLRRRFAVYPGELSTRELVDLLYSVTPLSS